MLLISTEIKLFIGEITYTSIIENFCFGCCCSGITQASPAALPGIPLAAWRSPALPGMMHPHPDPPYPAPKTTSLKRHLKTLKLIVLLLLKLKDPHRRFLFYLHFCEHIFSFSVSYLEIWLGLPRNFQIFYFLCYLRQTYQNFSRFTFFIITCFGSRTSFWNDLVFYIFLFFYDVTFTVGLPFLKPL